VRRQPGRVWRPHYQRSLSLLRQPAHPHPNILTQPTSRVSLVLDPILSVCDNRDIPFSIQIYIRIHTDSSIHFVDGAFCSTLSSDPGQDHNRSEYLYVSYSYSTSSADHPPSLARRPAALPHYSGYPSPQRTNPKDSALQSSNFQNSALRTLKLLNDVEFSGIGGWMCE
jgi:hypothetical protein